MIKVCACCKRSYTIAEWSALDHAGLQDDCLGGYLEMRVCVLPCTNTLVLPLEVVESARDATRKRVTIVDVAHEYNEALQMAAEYAAAERLAS